jgi:hypothetical protein
VSRKRKPADAQTTHARTGTVKTTVVLDVNTHTKLVAAAALRGLDRSTLAAGFIEEGLRGVVVFDRTLSSGNTGDEDRPNQRALITLDARESA